MTGSGKIGSSWVKFNWVRFSALGIHKIVKRNALDESDFFLHHVLWFLIKDDFQNRDCADGVDFGKYISRFDQFRITCLISRELVSHDPNLHEAFRITWKCNFFYQIKIYLTVKRPRG